MTQDDLSLRLADLGNLLVAGETLDSTLSQIASLSTSLVMACDGCGISLLHDGDVSTRHSSGAHASRVDEIQYSTGEGPCLEAIDTGSSIDVPSFAEERRWPEFIAGAEVEGIKSSYSAPLRIDDDIVGSLNLYSKDARFDDPDRELAEQLASRAAIAVRNAQTFQKIHDMVGQLEDALASRDTIGQAKGILVERHGVSSQEAFALLRQASQHRNVKLRDLATAFVDGATTIDTDADAGRPQGRRRPGAGY